MTLSCTFSKTNKDIIRLLSYIHTWLNNLLRNTNLLCVSCAHKNHTTLFKILQSEFWQTLSQTTFNPSAMFPFILTTLTLYRGLIIALCQLSGTDSVFTQMLSKLHSFSISKTNSYFNISPITPSVPAMVLFFNIRKACRTCFSLFFLEN